MNQVMIDIWPYLTIPIIGAIGWLFREIIVLKTKVVVNEKAIDAMKETIKTTTDTIQHTIESIQKRQDGHSKKQDEIVQLITDLKVGFLKELGDVSVNMASMASNIDNLTNLIKVTDLGIKLDNSSKPGKKK